MTIGQNTVIKNYKFIRKIGSGGMGEVFEAEDIALKRKVAVKILNPSLLTSEIIVKRFREEAIILASLTHDNIVKVYTFFEFQNNYFMVMEHIDGLTLKEKLSHSGLMTENNAEPIILQVLDALSYAHDKNVIHRDIKSSNIMISSSGNVKLMDFGIAKQLSEEFSKDSGLTGTIAQMGTVHYMSPEQIKSTKGVDKRTDIFSLGITYFEILTANLPYDVKDKSDFEIMKQIEQNPLPNPKNYYPHISEVTISILKKMTEKDVKNRFQNCQEVKKYLLNEQLSKSLVKEPVRLPKKTKKKSKKLVFFLLILVIATIVSLFNKDAIIEYFNKNTLIISPASISEELSIIKKSENTISPLTQSNIYAAIFSNDLSSIILGARSGSLEQLNLSSPNKKMLFNFNKIIWSLYSKSGMNNILIGSDDGAVQKYNLNNGSTEILYNYPKPIYCLTVLNDFGEVGLSQDQIFHLPQKNIYKEVLENNINTICSFRDGSLIAFGDKAGNVKICEQTELNKVAEFKINVGIYSIEFIDQNNVILGCENGIISIWDIKSKTNPIKLRDINEQKGIIKALKYDYTTGTLLSYSLNNTIFKWEIKTR